VDYYFRSRRGETRFPRLNEAEVREYVAAGQEGVVSDELRRLHLGDNEALTV
jgi:hypothetical protein